MAIKESELYSSVWASCDELRGGMDDSIIMPTNISKEKKQFQLTI